MTKFLGEKGIKHQYWVCNQVDNYRFNRGELLNLGVKISSQSGSNYFALHDVDLLPLNKRLDYRFPRNSGIYHVSRP
eukprot:Pgem_evm1s17802